MKSGPFRNSHSFQPFDPMNHSHLTPNFNSLNIVSAEPSPAYSTYLNYNYDSSTTCQPYDYAHYNASCGYYNYDSTEDAADSPNSAGQQNQRRARPAISRPQRKAANERERRRMSSINEGFELLRGTLPTIDCERKLSKVETLKGAIDYIRELTRLLEHEKIAGVAQQRLIISSSDEENPPTVCMVSWRRIPQKYGEVHQSTRGPIVYQKAVWTPKLES